MPRARDGVAFRVPQIYYWQEHHSAVEHCNGRGAEHLRRAYTLCERGVPRARDGVALRVPLATGSFDNTVKLWDIATGARCSAPCKSIEVRNVLNTKPPKNQLFQLDTKRICAWLVVAGLVVAPS